MQPELSFTVVADRFATIAELVASLQAQTARDRIELVIATFSARELELDEDALAGLAVRVVEVAPVSLAHARATSARAATAPYVFLGETHSYPDPGWAEAVLRAHADGADIVMPVLSNGNPPSVLGWASFLLAYSRSAAPARSKRIRTVPIHTASFRRELLAGYAQEKLTFADRLTLLPGEDRPVIQRTSAARLAHVNITEPMPWVRERIDVGRLFALERSRAWPRGRRLGYVVCSPVIPVVYLARVFRELGARRFVELPLLTIPAMVLGTLVWTYGEVLGYLTASPGISERRDLDYELHRDAYSHREA